MWFLTSLVFTLMFYVIPLSYLVHRAIAQWEALPAGLREFLFIGTRFNLPYILLMSILYVGCYFLLKWLLTLTEVVDEGVIRRLNVLLSAKGLRRFNSIVLGLVCLLLVIGFAYNYTHGFGSLSSQSANRFMGEPLFFLCVILFIGFANNLIRVLPISAPKPRVLYEGEDLEEEEGEDGELEVTGADIVRTFRWTYNDQPHMPGSVPNPYAVQVTLNEGRYQQLRAEEREVDVMRWDKYVKRAAPEVLTLAAYFRESREKEGWSSFTEIGNLLTFVQSLEYQRDQSPEGEEIDWPKYPLETLWEEGGDSEDSAILAASLLLPLGYDVALLFVPSHAALGIAGADGLPGTFLEVAGRRYYYYETTATGWEFGELPERYRGTNFRVLPIEAEEVTASS